MEHLYRIFGKTFSETMNVLFAVKCFKAFFRKNEFNDLMK